MIEMADDLERHPRYLTDKRYTFAVYPRADIKREETLTIWADNLVEAVDMIVSRTTFADWVWTDTSNTAAAMRVEVKQ